MDANLLGKVTFPSQQHTFFEPLAQSRSKFVGEGKMAKYVNTANAHRYIADYQDSPSMRNTLRCEKAWHLYNQMRLQYLRHCWD